MSRITGSIPSLFNGISQQTPALRLPTQGSEQTNFYPSLVQGLVKRPPLEVINDSISGEALSTQGTTHLVDRGGDNGGRERCFIFVTNKGITAFRPDGTQKPVYTDTEALAYLAYNNTSRFSILTLADYTFISNPAKNVAMSDTVSPSDIECGIGVIKQAAYDTGYKLSFKIGEDNYNFSVKTWSSVGTTDSPRDKISINNIVDIFEICITCVPPDENGFIVNGHSDIDISRYEKRQDLPFEFKKDDGVLIIYPLSGQKLEDFKFTDDEGGQLTRTIYDKAERFSDLPSKAPDGFIVKITGDDTTRFNDYYLMYSESEGSWKECPAPGIRVRLDPTTLPHVLIDNGDSFTFKKYDDWGERTCGDDDTSPIPEFVGYPITGLFQYRNRLGFLSDDIVALSEASEFFNFWNTTVMTAVDNDPIYLSASVEGAPTLRWAVPFNEEVVLFSDRAQFKLASPEVLSPSTASVQTITNYSMNTAIKPMSNGRNIFFADSQANTILSNSARIYEYYIDTDMGTKAAAEVTSHVPQYISGEITDMACSPGLNLLVVYVQGKSTVWFYKYYWSGNEKLQAAWFKAEFGTRKLVGAEFIGDVLYCLVNDNGRYFLCKLDFSITLDDASDALITQEPTGVKPFTLYLDMKNNYDPVGVYDKWENVSYLIVPNYYDKEKFVIVDTKTLMPLEVVRWDDVMSQCVVRGNVMNNDHLVIGEVFDSTYTFSPAVVRAQQQNGQLTVYQGRLQLQKWRLVLGPTGYLKAEVFHEHGQQFAYSVVHLCTGTPRHLLGRMNTREVTYHEFPVRGDASQTTVRLTNDTWFPSTIVSAEWDANYITKGRQHL